MTLQRSEVSGVTIKGMVETSFVDWDGNIVATLFLPGCNFRCGFCFNAKLVLEHDTLDDVPISYVHSYLRSNSDFLDGVCITGGEPTLHSLEELCSLVKSTGLKVKLDTNGSNPEALERLIDSRLVDFVAMDVKAPLREREYSKAAGVPVDLKAISESIELIAGEVEHEFRTTVVRGVHDRQSIREIAGTLERAGARRYVLQKFIPELAMSEELRRVKSMSDAEMDELVEVAAGYLPAKWRGR